MRGMGGSVNEYDWNVGNKSSAPESVEVVNREQIE